MTVRAEHWAQVKELFEGGLALPAEARPAYLASIPDATIRQAVEKLLRSHERSGSFLETPAARPLPALSTISLEGCRLGPYQLESRIGAGGMGEVYSARDSRLNRTVAIKVLPAHGLLERQARERLEREARAVAMINHPNICTLHDIGRQDEVDFLVMEYLEGETLAARLSRGPLPIDQALQCARQIASALDAAHRAGVIHRDLK
ncbi:MAG: serine/threonine-protein kinase, partial [Vicinamibacterales bacterium]